MLNTTNAQSNNAVHYNEMPQKNKSSNKGFASLSLEKKREIASAGGKAAHLKGRAYKFDSNKASEAGRKGGLAVSKNREHMAQIGKKGGESRSKKANHKQYDNIMKPV
jgi:general stress protein YciG